MHYRKYFEKNGVIYGASLKFEFGKWTGYGQTFDNLDDAESWLYTEEYDFRDRKLMSKTEFKRKMELIG